MSDQQSWPCLSGVWSTLCVEAERNRINFWSWHDGSTTDVCLLEHERKFEVSSEVQWHIGYLHGAADALGVTVRELLDGAGLDLREESDNNERKEPT